VSAPNQMAAINALKSIETFQLNLERILTEKDRLLSELGKLKLIKKIYPSKANFILTEVEDANRVYLELINRSIVTRNRNDQIENCLRITVGNEIENNKLIEALKEIDNEKTAVYR